MTIKTDAITVTSLYTATGAVMALKVGLPVLAGISIGLCLSAVLVGIGYVLKRLGVMYVV